MVHSMRNTRLRPLSASNCDVTHLRVYWKWDPSLPGLQVPSRRPFWTKRLQKPPSHFIFSHTLNHVLEPSPSRSESRICPYLMKWSPLWSLIYYRQLWYANQPIDPTYHKGGLFINNDHIRYLWGGFFGNIACNNKNRFIKVKYWIWGKYHKTF